MTKKILRGFKYNLDNTKHFEGIWKGNELLVGPIDKIPTPPVAEEHRHIETEKIRARLLRIEKEATGVSLNFGIVRPPKARPETIEEPEPEAEPEKYEWERPKKVVKRRK